MPPLVSLEEVQSYRKHLGRHWGIKPILHMEEIFRQLSNKDRKPWNRLVNKMVEATVSDELAFYEWIAHDGRFGLGHSAKWCQILTSGVWAAAMLRELVPMGPVVDLGCNAGYWTSWVSQFRGNPVIGIDYSEPIIEYGRRRLREAQLPGELRVGDFTEMPRPKRFLCAVSLQGLTRHLLSGDHEVLSKVGATVAEGGHLLLVDAAHDWEAFFDAVERAGFSVRGAGMVGGVLLDGEWAHYPGLILRKDGGPSASLATVKECTDGIWEEFSEFANANSDDWTKRNSAYFMAAGGPTFRMF